MDTKPYQPNQNRTNSKNYVTTTPTQSDLVLMKKNGFHIQEKKISVNDCIQENSRVICDEEEIQELAIWHCHHFHSFNRKLKLTEGFSNICRESCAYQVLWRTS